MANYVEGDGDWVLRPPGRLDGVTMYAFVVKAGQAELQALCDKFINTPSGGLVTAAPLVPHIPFVVLVCADIARGASLDADDTARGWQTERDVGFFVPITLSWPGHSRPAALLPYLFVSNFVAVLIGREVFGFPKVLATVDYDAQPLRFTVTSTTKATNDPNQPAVPGTVIDIRSTAHRPSVPIPGILDDALLAVIDVVIAALGLPASLRAAFTQVPMTFLKQFRDAEQRAAAAHQSIVLACANIDQFTGGAILLDHFELTLPAYDHIHIAKTLGLGAGTTFASEAAVRLDIVFSLPFGETLWRAP